MDLERRLEDLLLADAVRMWALTLVRSLGLRDCWIGAGFVRDAVWDHLHGRATSNPHGDVDVIWHDREDSAETVDRTLETRLRDRSSELRWSVKNRARMHVRNGDSPYPSVAEAMRHWPETATAVGVALDENGRMRINAPFGLEDLYAPRLQPTPAFETRKRPIYDERVSSKDWVRRYPLLAAIEVGDSTPDH